VVPTLLKQFFTTYKLFTPGFIFKEEQRRRGVAAGHVEARVLLQVTVLREGLATLVADERLDALMHRLHVVQ